MWNSDGSPSGGAALTIALSGVLGAAFIGFAVGTSGSHPSGAPVRSLSVGAPRDVAQTEVLLGASAVEAARSWKDMRVHDSAAPERWTAPSPPLPSDEPSPRATVSDADVILRVSERMALRAYDGAPPVIPHPVEQGGNGSCLICHGEGQVIGQLRAPRPSHPLTHSQCTQCHVPAGSPVPGQSPTILDGQPIALPAANLFEGLQPTVRGPRAWDIAPPQIPHPTLMRSECTSCHSSGGHSADGMGHQGSNPLRTSHPWRQSCTQCHTPSAEQDQWGRQ